MPQPKPPHRQEISIYRLSNSARPKPVSAKSDVFECPRANPPQQAARDRRPGTPHSEECAA